MALVISLYRSLLLLYPANFRDEYGGEMTRLMADRLRDSPTRFQKVFICIHAVTDLLIAAPVEHATMIINDVRYAVRSLRTAKGFTTTALLTIALGVGANTAIFSVIEAVLLRQLPYRDPDQIVMVWVKNPQQGFDHDLTSYPRLLDWRAASKLISGFAAYAGTRRALTGSGEPEQLNGVMASVNFLDVMGAEAAIGAAFSHGDDESGRPRKVLLSHGLWLRRFGGDPGVVGRPVTLDGRLYTVSGVMPSSFHFPDRATDYWEPLVVNPDLRNERGAFWLTVVARLKPGASLSQAQQEMNAISHRLAVQYAVDRGLSATLVGLKDELTARIRPALFVLAAAVGVVMLIACANVAGMLMARAAHRQRELALRAALGAGRGQIIRQLLTEAMVLFALGGALGFVFGAAGIRAIMRLAPPALEDIRNLRMNGIVGLYALAMALTSGLVFGILPALHGTRRLGDAVRSGSRGIAGHRAAAWFRTMLLAAEVALSLVLLTGAGLFLRSFYRLQAVDLGFDSNNLVAARIDLSPARYDSDAKSNAFMEALLSRLRASPGIESAAAVTDLLLERLPNSAGFSIEGRPKDTQTPLTYDSVTPEFFRTMRVPLLRGRFFTPSDNERSERVIIINATTARRYWPGEHPVGKRIRFGGGPNNTNPWLTIVGVVGDTLRAGLDNPVFTESYQPLAQAAARRMTLVIRTAKDVQSAASALRAALRESDPQQPLTGVAPVQAMLDESVAPRRFNMLLVNIFAAASLLLAAIGVYGLLAYIITQEQREIGIRIALGASAAQIARAVATRVAAATSAGAVLGIFASLAMSRGVAGLLYGIGALDPLTYAGALIVMGFVVMSASLVPLMRALNVDPAVTLRGE